MTERISDIREKINNAQLSMLPNIIDEFKDDTRIGVVNILKSALERYKKYTNELDRTKRMSWYENLYCDRGLICGIDEVGRGPLAGPVVAAAVILDKNEPILYIDDSKKLAASLREVLYEEIMDKAVAVGIGVVDNIRIDEINILQATYQAMRDAIFNLNITPDILLNDAVIIPDISIEQIPIIKGDSKSISIAAASIVAKVIRDRMMIEYSKSIKGYGFESNKGYGTREHIQALADIGACSIHRQTFISKMRVNNGY